MYSRLDVQHVNFMFIISTVHQKIKIIIRTYRWQHSTVASYWIISWNTYPIHTNNNKENSSSLGKDKAKARVCAAKRLQSCATLTGVMVMVNVSLPCQPTYSPPSPEEDRNTRIQSIVKVKIAVNYVNLIIINIVVHSDNSAHCFNIIWMH